ncbi:MAG: TolC family protein [Sedimentisphaerales bacterium]|nr:TolC family protein [Sedimentisphaerales bacterium]
MVKSTFTTRSVRSLMIAAPALVLAPTGCAQQRGLQETRETNAAQDMRLYRSRAPTIEGALTLEDALDYAARHNIEAWIAAEEVRIQQESVTQMTLRMLPSLRLGTGHQERSRYDASSSQSLETGNESLEPSFSSEKRGTTFDISATWNLLDFGISFLRARQQENRASISMQRERRTRQNLAFQVVRAYWRAAAAKEIAGQAEFLNADISALLEKTRNEIAAKAISQVEGLKRETSFMQRQDELRQYEREYLSAKTELANLIGLSPNTPFVLAPVDFQEHVNTVQHDTVTLEWQALRSRPELFEKDLEQVISRDEAYVAIAQMLPSPAVFWRCAYDSNRFLAFRHWNTIGINASWDLLAVPHRL